MRTKQVDTRLPKRVKNEPKWRQILTDFARSGANQLELVPEHGEYKSLKVAQSVVCTAIRRYGFNMSTIRDGGKLYLVKDINGAEKNKNPHSPEGLQGGTADGL